MENLTIREIVSRYKRGEFDIVAWNKTFIKNIHEKEVDIHAWEYFNEEEWLNKLDAVLQNHPQKFSNLLGVPVGIKDIFNTIDMPTCMGSPIWKDFTPGNDARVVHNIKFQGGISAGKTVTAEFAVHTPNETRNPWNKEYSPGTSSSGSAAAVAAGMVPLSIGTQTAGSIIRPASYCGVYGFKPSFGTLPRTGILKTTDTLDTIGLFANNVDDCKLLFDAMRVKGLDYPVVYNNLENEANQQKLSDKWKIGVVLEQHKSSEIISDYALSAFQGFISTLENNKNYQINSPTFSPLFNKAHQVQETIYHKALEYYFKKEFENKSLISPVMYEIINEGTKISADEYHKNIQLQNDLASEIDGLFLENDVLITLSTAGYAPKFGVAIDPQDTCLIWTMCGLPVINIPLFNHNGMPFGLQIIGKKYQDYKLLNFVNQLEILKNQQ
jgi:Asp-tRNA(Asn)/Glu-tRNA(Gln) amidotransferase A subunit family amidase